MLEIQTPGPISGGVFSPPPQLHPDLASRLLCPHDSQSKNRPAAYTSIKARVSPFVFNAAFTWEIKLHI